ncbi:MAG: YfiR family protein [Bacteroidota bacterium]
MKRIISLLILACFLTSADIVRLAPPALDTTTKIKAQFLYNFTKYIEWPASYKQGNFVICIIGNNKLYNDLNTFFTGKMLGTQKYEVKYFAKPADIMGACHLIYLPSDYTGSMADVTAKAKGKSTLIVTDKPGMAKQGSAINFVYVDNKQKFEMNKNNIEKYDLKVSSSLVNLAILVE